MCGYVTWHADEVSQGIKILEGASEVLLPIQLRFRANWVKQANLTEKSLRINAVVGFVILFSCDWEGLSEHRRRCRHRC